MTQTNAELYLGVTPAGAYHASAAATPGTERSLLQRLLAAAETPRVSDVPWQEWVPDTDPTALLLRMESLGWLWGLETAQRAPAGSLEQLLPECLPALSAQGQALLADHQGLQIGYAGFDDDQAQAIAAISSDAIALSFRYSRILGIDEDRGPGACGVIDAAGHSQIGIWPLFCGNQWFALAIAGRPRLNHPDFQRLVWALNQRAVQPDGA
jgi:hypothetical protein